MVNSVDNPLARFLYAILKQKNLKDIDWNLVAADPALIEAVPNGHAARMRYSRYKSTVQKAIESGEHKRSRTSDSGRVTKTKKDSRGRQGSVIKSESGGNLSSLAQFSPASMASSAFTTDSRDEFSARFLTPCSDDMTQNIPTQPTAPENFPPPGSQFLDAASHDPTSPSYSAFNNAYDLSGFDISAGDVQEQSGLDMSEPSVIGGNEWMDRFNDHHTF